MVKKSTDERCCQTLKYGTVNLWPASGWRAASPRGWKDGDLFYVVVKHLVKLLPAMTWSTDNMVSEIVL